MCKAEDKTGIYVDGYLPLTREVDFLRSKKDGGREKVKKLLTVDLYTEKSVFSATKYNHI